MKSIENKKACATDDIACESIKYGGSEISIYDAKRIVSACISVVLVNVST